MANIAPQTSRSFRFTVTSTLVLLAGCHKGPQQGVLATVDGKPVLQSEVDKIYATQIAENPQQYISTDEAQAKRLQIVGELILDQIVEQRAAKQNLTATDADVDAKIAEYKAPYTEEQFQAKLKAKNLSVDDLKRDLRHSLTQNKLLNKEINSRITVTDADVNNYYSAHKAEFNVPENQYHLAQIIVTTAPATSTTNLQNSKASSADEAKKKIQVLKNKLEAGEDFGTIAMSFSENSQTASGGGDMGSITESQLRSNPGLYTAITKLKAGQDTDIIPFPDPADPKKIGGYAIFRLLERASAGQRDLNDPRVQQQIRQQLHDSRSQLLKAAYSEMIHDQAKIQNFLAEQVFKNNAK